VLVRLAINLRMPYLLRKNGAFPFASVNIYIENALAEDLLFAVAFAFAFAPYSLASISLLPTPYSLIPASSLSSSPAVR